MEREHTGIRARLSQAERREADLTDALRHARDQRERVDLTGHLAELNVQTMTLRARVGHISTALDQLKKEKP